MLKVDPKMLVDEFVYEEFESNDDWGETVYKEPVTVTNVRIDRNTVYSRDKTQTQIVADSIIFCYASATSPFIDFKEQSRVTFDGNEYVIKKVVLNKEPFQNAIFSYELEVL